MSINYMYVHKFMQNLYKLLILEELILFIINYNLIFLYFKIKQFK